MASGGVVVGFLLMLLLPCAITLFGDAEGGDEQNGDLDQQPGDPRALAPEGRPHSPAIRSRATVRYQTESAVPVALHPHIPAAKAAKVQSPVSSLLATESLAVHQPQSQPPVRRRETWHEVTTPAGAAPALSRTHVTVRARTQVPGWEQPASTLPVRPQTQPEDSMLPHEETQTRWPRVQHTRLQMAELDVLRARAIAVRAHAEALAAVARAARAKAEAAADEAMDAEQEARNMSQYVRRAA